MNPIPEALANVEMLEVAEGVGIPGEQRAVGLLSVAAALQARTVLESFTDARVRFVDDGEARYNDGEIEISRDWVRVVDDDQWIPRDRVRTVDPN